MLGRFYRKLFDINVTTDAFLEAVQQDNVELVNEYIDNCVQAIQQQPASLPSIQHFFLTVLKSACDKGNYPMADVLTRVPQIDLRAQSKEQNDQFRLIVKRAEDKGYRQLSRLLATRLLNRRFPIIQVSLPESRLNRKQFLDAAKRGDFRVIRQYIDENMMTPDAVNAIDEETGNTALIYAAGRGNTTIVLALLAAPGIELTIRNKQGFTALMEAMSNDCSDVVFVLKNRLIKLGMEEHVVNYRNSPPSTVVNPLQDQLDSLRHPVKVPDDFICPITQSVMTDPVQLPNFTIKTKRGLETLPGQIYDRSSLTNMFAKANNREEMLCPVTRVVIQRSVFLTLGTKVELKRAIEAFVLSAVQRDKEMTEKEMVSASSQGLFSETPRRMSMPLPVASSSVLRP